MLLYLGTGTRRYGTSPFRICERGCWEFQTVVKGEIGMSLPEGEPVLRKNWLWLTPPNHAHGWVGRGNRAAEVAVFHFPSLPEPLLSAARNAGSVEMPLAGGQVERLRALAIKADAYKSHPSSGMMLCHQHILHEISLLVYEHMHASSKELPVNDLRVGEALRWFSERMADNPDQEAVAKAVNMSASHLRRLFHEVIGISPKRALDQLRFQRAVELMSNSGIKLSIVSEACGFTSQSAFSRAFKTKFGCSPEAWRG